MIKLVNRWISIEFIITNKKLNLWQIEKNMRFSKSSHNISSLKNS